MTQRILLVTVATIIGLSIAKTQRTSDAAQPSGYSESNPAAPEKPVMRVRAVYNLMNIPAVDVAENITRLLRSERSSRADEVAIVPESIGNRLLISATPSMLQAVMTLIEKVDVRPKSVVIEALVFEAEREDGAAGASLRAKCSEVPKKGLASLIDELKKESAVKIHAHLTVMTLDNQPAFVQIGQRVPGRWPVVNKGSQKADTPYRNVGIILGVTPRVRSDNVVVMAIDLEKSVAVKGTAISMAAPRIDVITTQTTVAVESGQAVVLGGLEAKSTSAVKELLMVVAARVIEPSN
jgi:type II secretory pathway component GspD/PulD (secretin)